MTLILFASCSTGDSASWLRCEYSTDFDRAIGEISFENTGSITLSSKGDATVTATEDDASGSLSIEFQASIGSSTVFGPGRLTIDPADVQPGQVLIDQVGEGDGETVYLLCSAEEASLYDQASSPCTLDSTVVAPEVESELMAVSPANARPGDVITVEVFPESLDGEASLSGSVIFECWDGIGWLPIYQLPRNSTNGSLAVDPFTTVTFTGQVGLAPVQLTVPDVDPGRYRIREVISVRLPDGSLVTENAVATIEVGQ